MYENENKGRHFYIFSVNSVQISYMRGVTSQHLTFWHQYLRNFLFIFSIMILKCSSFSDAKTKRRTS